MSPVCFHILIAFSMSLSDSGFVLTSYGSMLSLSAAADGVDFTGLAPGLMVL